MNTLETFEKVFAIYHDLQNQVLQINISVLLTTD